MSKLLLKLQKMTTALFMVMLMPRVNGTLNSLLVAKKSAKNVIKAMN